MVGRAKAHGLKVFTLTLNTGAYIRAAVAFGVDGFATDDPCQTEEILKSLAS